MAIRPPYRVVTRKTCEVGQGTSPLKELYIYIVVMVAVVRIECKSLLTSPQYIVVGQPAGNFPRG